MRTRLLRSVSRAYTLLVCVALAPGVAQAQNARAASASSYAPEQLSLQVALDRAGFSPGEIDGLAGPRTRLALAAFQAAMHAGSAGEGSAQVLHLPQEPLTTYTITQQDVAGPFIEKMPADMMESAKLDTFGYTSALEELAERFHSSPSLLRRLNPSATWIAGEAIAVPDVEPLELPAKIAKPTGEKNAASGVEVVISGPDKSLIVRDASGKTLMYAPITVGSEKDPLPAGDWKVTSVSWNPVFNYNPELFWDADPAHAKAKIPAGPNNPVGIVWIDINKEHFGLHGTPEPSTIGRTESHGCIRLTNWDAKRLGQLVNTATKVTIR